MRTEGSLRRGFGHCLAAALIFSAVAFAPATVDAADLPVTPGRHRIHVTSTMDGTQQPSYLLLPEGFRAEGERRPLVVSLHTWSSDLEQRGQFVELEERVLARGWLYLFPNFRGRNNQPEACGSKLAQQDILDALDHVLAHYPVDTGRIYLTGVSGGGHMTMLMSALYPERWTAASAWVGISDLAAWHRKHADDRYGEEMRAVFGGRPEDSPEILREYMQRSPITHLAGAAGVALDLAAGRHDGHEDLSVPIRHTLDAFNEIARATDGELISPQEIEQLSRQGGALAEPQLSDRATDESFGRELFLRRTAARARVTIFEGGHEWIPAAIMAWFDAHPRRGE